MNIPSWVWYVVLMAAVVGSLILVRRWSYNIAIRFEHDGREYTRHRDGRFTDEAGNPVDSALAARLEPVAEAAKRERFRRMDSRPR